MRNSWELIRTFLAPDTDTGGGESASSEPVESQDTSSSETSESTETEIETETAEEEYEEFKSARDWASKNGHETVASRFQSDDQFINAAAQALAAQERWETERQQLRDQAVYAQAQLRAQQEARQAAQPKQEVPERAYWNPPKADRQVIAQYWDAEAMNWKPETPPQVREVGDQYRAYLRKYHDDFTHDPFKTIQPGVEDIATKIAQKLINDRFGAIEQKQAAHSALAKHSQELHAFDNSGRPVLRPDGSQDLNPYGVRVAFHVQRLEQAGLTDYDQLIESAMALTDREIAAYRTANPTRQEPPKKKKKAPVHSATVSTVKEVNKERPTSIRDMLKKNLEKANIQSMD